MSLGARLVGNRPATPPKPREVRFLRFENKARVALVLHPRMPEKTIIVRAMTALGIADVCYGNEPSLESS